MYIKYENINGDDICIDVRTPEEFNKMPLFEHNVPIINKKQHDYLKSHIYLAIPIVVKGFFENRIAIKERLLSRVKDNANYSIANFNDYLWMKENVSHVDDNLVDYIINTETNIEEQVDNFINQYNLNLGSNKNE